MWGVRTDEHQSVCCVWFRPSLQPMLTCTPICWMPPVVAADDSGKHVAGGSHSRRSCAIWPVWINSSSAASTGSWMRVLALAVVQPAWAGRTANASIEHSCKIAQNAHVAFSCHQIASSYQLPVLSAPMSLARKGQLAALCAQFMRYGFGTRTAAQEPSSSADESADWPA